jgi:hypothetical protein
VFYAQGATRMREVHFQRFDGRAPDAPGFLAPVALGRYEGKRGVLAVRRASRALIVG